MTWAMLLSRWVDLARAAVALPTEDRWRRSVVDVIGLQAVTCALGEALTLPTAERLLGVDRAGVLIGRHVAALNDTWRGEPMPERLLELMSDARRALQGAAEAGAEWVVAVDRLEMPPVVHLLAGHRGDALGAAPGTVLFRGEPALFVRPETVVLDVRGLERGAGVTAARQVYRRAGEDPHDLVAPLEGALPAGCPLLGWLMREGEVQPAPPTAHTAAPRGMLEVRMWPAPAAEGPAT